MRRALEYARGFGRDAGPALRGRRAGPRRPHARGGVVEPPRRARHPGRGRGAHGGTATSPWSGSPGDACTFSISPRRGPRQLVAEAKAEGLDVTAEVTPHHLSSDRRRAGRVRPGVQGEPAAAGSSDVAALRAACVDGTVDAVATDHAPHRPSARTPPSTPPPRACSGSRPPSPWCSACPGRDVGRSRARLCCRGNRPASPGSSRHQGGDQGGPLEPGAPANLCVFDPAARGRSTRPGWPAGAATRPWAGRVLTGRVRHTVYRGGAGGRRRRGAAVSPGDDWTGGRSPALLVLADGEVFEGEAIGAVAPGGGWPPGSSCSTPCCRATRRSSPTRATPVRWSPSPTPHIGNYGVTPDDDEATRPWCRGVVVRDVAPRPSSWRSTGSFDDFLARHGAARDLRGRHPPAHPAPPRSTAPSGAPSGRRRSRRPARRSGLEPGTRARTWCPGCRQRTPYERGSGPLPGRGLRLRRERDHAALPGRAGHRDGGARRLPRGRRPGHGARRRVPLQRARRPRRPARPAAIVADLLGRVPVFGICLGHQLLAEALGARTYKLPFGHHGGNHPVRRLDTGRVEITSQNHNYAVDGSSLPTSGPPRPRSRTSTSTTVWSRGSGAARWSLQRAVPPRGRSRSPRRPVPVRGVPAHDRRRRRRADAPPQRLESILVIGSGPIVIGQACEFDYSGSQACRVLRAEGYRVILANSNPATIMTDPEIADRTYVEPLDLDVLSAIVERERPDALLPTMGGQTALNLAMELSERGVIEDSGSTSSVPTPRPSTRPRTGTGSRRPWRRSASRCRRRVSPPTSTRPWPSGSGSASPS